MEIKLTAKESIGNYMKQRRRELKMTQKDLSKLIGFSNTYISDMEVGRVAPSVQTLCKIVAALNTEIVIRSIT